MFVIQNIRNIHSHWMKNIRFDWESMWSVFNLGQFKRKFKYVITLKSEEIPIDKWITPPERAVYASLWKVVSNLSNFQRNFSCFKQILLEHNLRRCYTGWFICKIVCELFEWSEVWTNQIYNTFKILSQNLLKTFTIYLYKQSLFRNLLFNIM